MRLPVARVSPARATAMPSLLDTAMRSASSSEMRMVARVCAASGDARTSSAANVLNEKRAMSGSVTLNETRDLGLAGRTHLRQPRGIETGAERAEERADVPSRRLVARIGKGIGDDVAHERVSEEGAHEHRDGGLDVGICIRQTERLKAQHIIGEQHAGAVRSLTHGDSGLWPLFELTDGFAQNRTALAEMRQDAGAPTDDLGFRI